MINLKNNPHAKLPQPQSQPSLFLPPPITTTPIKLPPSSSIYNKSTHKKRRTDSFSLSTNPSNLLDLLFKQLDNLVQITSEEHPVYLQFQKQNTLLYYQNKALEYECEVLEDKIEREERGEGERENQMSEMERAMEEIGEEVKGKLEGLLRDIVRKQSDMMMYLENLIEFMED